VTPAPRLAPCLEALVERVALGHRRAALDVAAFLSAPHCVEAMRYGAMWIRGDADGPTYDEKLREEILVLAPVVLRAAIVLDRSWAAAGEEEYGELGAACLRVAEALGPHADAIRLVPENVWSELAAESEPLDETSWWGNARVVMIEAQAAANAQMDYAEGALRARLDAVDPEELQRWVDGFATARGR
jgi:hypothetical protein